MRSLYPITDGSFFARNREKLYKQLPAGAALIIAANSRMRRNGDQYFPFRQDSDFFYLTGIRDEDAVFVAFPDSDEPFFRESLFLKEPNPARQVWTGEKLDIALIKKISGISSVGFLSKFDAFFNVEWDKKSPVFIGSNAHLGDSIEQSALHNIKTKLQKNYKDIVFEPLAPITQKVRHIKEKEEIDLIKQACSITSKAFGRVLKTLKAGMMEYEVEAELWATFMGNGANGHAYPPIVASGINACTLHYEYNNQKCADGDLLLMDFGAEYGNYASDCSRTIPVNGRFTSRQRACYDAVLRVQKEAKNLLLPGNTMYHVNDTVNQLLEKEMIDLGLFSRREARYQDPMQPLFQKYYMHGVSHHIGLDVHDSIFQEGILEKGMVLSFEPGLYIPEEGIGIRIENDFVVAAEPINLMEDIPMEVDEIEALMNQ